MRIHQPFWRDPDKYVKFKRLGTANRTTISDSVTRELIYLINNSPRSDLVEKYREMSTNLILKNSLNSSRKRYEEQKK